MGGQNTLALTFTIANACTALKFAIRADLDGNTTCFEQRLSIRFLALFSVPQYMYADVGAMVVGFLSAPPPGLATVRAGRTMWGNHPNSLTAEVISR